MRGRGTVGYGRLSAGSGQVVGASAGAVIVRAMCALALAVLALCAAAPRALAAPDCPGGQIKPIALAATGDVLESVYVDPQGHLFYSDQSKSALMQLDLSSGASRQVASIAGPGQIVGQSDGSLVVGSGDGLENGLTGDLSPMSSLVRVDPSSGALSTVASGLGMANGVAQGADGSFYATNDAGFGLDRVTGSHVDHGFARVYSTNGVVVSHDGLYLYVDQTFAPPAIMRITLADPTQVTTFATPPATDLTAGLDDMTQDPVGNLYVAANGGGQVWRVATDGSICVLASGLLFPSAVAFGTGADASSLYVVGFGGEIDKLPRVVGSAH